MSKNQEIEPVDISQPFDFDALVDPPHDFNQRCALCRQGRERSVMGPLKQMPNGEIGHAACLLYRHTRHLKDVQEALAPPAPNVIRLPGAATPADRARWAKDKADRQERVRQRQERGAKIKAGLVKAKAERAAKAAVLAAYGPPRPPGRPLRRWQVYDPRRLAWNDRYGGLLCEIERDGAVWMVTVAASADGWRPWLDLRVESDAMVGRNRKQPEKRVVGLSHNRERFMKMADTEFLARHWPGVLAEIEVAVMALPDWIIPDPVREFRKVTEWIDR